MTLCTLTQRVYRGCIARKVPVLHSYDDVPHTREQQLELTLQEALYMSMRLEGIRVIANDYGTNRQVLLGYVARSWVTRKCDWMFEFILGYNVHAFLTLQPYECHGVSLEHMRGFGQPPCVEPIHVELLPYESADRPGAHITRITENRITFMTDGTY